MVDADELKPCATRRRCTVERNQASERPLGPLKQTPPAPRDKQKPIRARARAHGVARRGDSTRNWRRRLQRPAARSRRRASAAHSARSDLFTQARFSFFSPASTLAAAAACCQRVKRRRPRARQSKRRASAQLFIVPLPTTDGAREPPRF